MTGAIGRSATRSGGRARVTGAQKFAADVMPEDTLHAKLVTLDCGHAAIRSVDATAALELDGVVAVFTSADFDHPPRLFGPRFEDRPVIATGETKFHGEPVAIVIADTVETAREGVALVAVDYEELPGVYSVDDALADGAPVVDDPAVFEVADRQDANVREQWEYGWGDVDAAGGDFVVENEYRFPMVTHFAIEPHSFTAAPDGDGVVVWSPIQHPYLLQRTLADLLDMPMSKVRIFAPDPGGAFGGKGYAKFEPLVTLAALKLSRPVRLVLTLEETFQAVRRNSARIRIRTGFDSGGRVTFVDTVNDFLMGAYADIAPRVVSKATYLGAGPYRVPAASIVARALVSHTTPSTAFRGFGTPQVVWAMESQMDEAARRLGVDGLEIRLRNVAAPGETLVPGDRPADGDWREGILKAADAVGWGEPLQPGRGRGIAIGIKSSATIGASYCILRLLYDGSVVLIVGTTDMGQGARTVLAQIVSQELGVPMDAINVVMGDTNVVPFDLSTSASRSTVFMGRAVLNACDDIRGQLSRMVAQRHGLEESDVSVAADRVVIGDKETTLVGLIAEVLGPVRGEVIATASHRGEPVPEHPLGGPAAFYEFSATASEVEVDRDTGEVTLVKHVTVTDVGKALNPLQVEMQDEGAAVMGLGHTLWEQILLDESGRICNLGALDYRIPTFNDLPESMTSLTVENGDGPGPYGAKGTGEGALLATSPAIAAAVTQATGVVIRELPLTAERIWRAMREHESKEQT